MTPVAERSVFSTIPQAIDDLCSSGVVSDEDRENEGDVTIAGAIGSRRHHQGMRFEPDAYEGAGA